KGAAMAFNWGSQQTIKTLADGEYPAFFDADADGDMDFLLGKTNGELQLYLNQGTVSSPDYVLSISSLGGISPDFATGSLYPAVADVDGDDVPDLLTVDESGELKVYHNFTDKLHTNFTATTVLLENELTATTQSTRFGRGLSV